MKGLVERRPDDHKGVFGHVLVVGGSRGMTGAAILAARAALRSGAGLVTLAVPASMQAAAVAAAPEAMTLALPESSSGALRATGAALLKKEKKFTVMAIGPGLGRHPDSAKLVVGLLGTWPIPAVVDADALNALAALDRSGVKELLRRRKAPCILTPHPGEAARCLGVRTSEISADREGAALRLTRDWGAVTVLKGKASVVASGVGFCVNDTGGPGLAKGGTGDVLTGVIAALWAQLIASGRGEGDLAYQAAALGCRVHGLAGEAAEKAKTPWAMTAGDVVEALPAAFQRLS